MGATRAPDGEPSSTEMWTADVSKPWSAPRRVSSRPPLTAVALWALAAVVMLGAIGLSAADGLLGWDARFAYLPAAESVLGGDSPYPELDDPILEYQKGYVYPPQLLFVLMPLTALPVPVASALVALLMLALVGLTLYVLDVRDARCYAAAFLWVPAISGVLLSNISIPLAFALAVLWRYRDSDWPSATALGLAVSAKLLFWPMYVWMLATRRLRAAALSVAIGLAVTLGAWALIGFAGLVEYPDLLSRLSDIQSERSYSLVGIAAALGLPSAVGQGATFAIGLGCSFCASSTRVAEDEVRSFTCAVAATLALSPIMWLHYLVVLLVPMAIARPRFSLLWLLPVLLWVSPKPGYAEGVQTIFPAIAAGILLAILLARPQRRPAVRAAGVVSQQSQGCGRARFAGMVAVNGTCARSCNGVHDDTCARYGLDQAGLRLQGVVSCWRRAFAQHGLALHRSRELRAGRSRARVRLPASPCARPASADSVARGGGGVSRVPGFGRRIVRRTRNRWCTRRPMLRRGRPFDPGLVRSRDGERVLVARPAARGRVAVSGTVVAARHSAWDDGGPQALPLACARMGSGDRAPPCGGFGACARRPRRSRLVGCHWIRGDQYIP